MVSLKVFNSVGKELRRIEQAYDVRVLYACESGSRAWSFASQDSDYDVRFLYVHSRDWYLSIEDRRDVIEEPISDSLDISGWELRKTLRILRKSNPPLLEWRKSPVVYAWDEEFVSEFKQLADEYYSPARCFQHYRVPCPTIQAHRPCRSFLLNQQFSKTPRLNRAAIPRCSDRSPSGVAFPSWYFR